MGWRFSLQDANIVAYLLDGEEVPKPLLSKRRAAIRALRESLRTGFMSSPNEEEWLHRVLEYEENPLPQILNRFRAVPWKALLIPPPSSTRRSEHWTDRQFLRDLVDFAPYGGIVLQVDDLKESHGVLQLEQAFPAFGVALARASEWPGVLFWQHPQDARFFPLPDSAPDTFQFLQGLCITPPISRLDSSSIWHQEPVVGTSLNIIQLSDIHLGADHAGVRSSRTLQQVEKVWADYPGKKCLAITGDLVDTPTEDAFSRAELFLDQIEGITGERPYMVLGNHDVREGGYRESSDLCFRRLRMNPAPVIVNDETKTAFVFFDSTEGGKLAQGAVSEAHLVNVANELDRRKIRGEEYGLVGFVHHHPLSVSVPDWMARSRLMRLVHRFHAPTVAFSNSQLFLDFVESRSFRAVLHGHKHIPFFGHTPLGCYVIGCGSSTGMIENRKGRPVSCINVITLRDNVQKPLVRYMIEDVPGGGFSERADYIVLGTY